MGLHVQLMSVLGGNRQQSSLKKFMEKSPKFLD